MAYTEFVASAKDGAVDTRIFENTKQKNGECRPPMSFRLVPVEINSKRNGVAMTNAVLEPTVLPVWVKPLGPVQRAIVDYIKDNCPTPITTVAKEVADQLGKHVSNVKRSLDGAGQRTQFCTKVDDNNVDIDPFNKGMRS